MKPYMNEEELITELINNKRIKRETIPEGIFKERAYTMLVNPYKKLICENFDTSNKCYIYKQAGDFEEYINFANIDDYISNKFSIYIEYFEKYFKSYIGEKFAQKMKDNSIFCNDYSEIQSFLNQIPTISTIKNLLEERILNTNYHYTCYDFIHFDEMYDSRMKIVPASKNIMMNRRRAFDNLIYYCSTSRNTGNELISHHQSKR